MPLFEYDPQRGVPVEPVFGLTVGYPGSAIQAAQAQAIANALAAQAGVAQATNNAPTAEQVAKQQQQQQSGSAIVPPMWNADP